MYELLSEGNVSKLESEENVSKLVSDGECMS